jgi:hypothetical protein
MIHEAVGHGLEADLACNGLSVYQGKVGQQVASSLITVLDDGTMPARRGSYAYDDEGTPSQKTTLIENGILKGYLVDRLSAMKFDLPATGNGRRETFRNKPIVRMTNTYIAPGKDDPAQILKDTKEGIFVKAMGGGQVNTVTGDFVFAVTEGYLIRDGKLGEAIRGATLVGNGPRVMEIVDRVGSDLGFATGTCGKDGQKSGSCQRRCCRRGKEVATCRSGAADVQAAAARLKLGCESRNGNCAHSSLHICARHTLTRVARSAVFVSPRADECLTFLHKCASSSSKSDLRSLGTRATGFPGRRLIAARSASGLLL